MSLQIPTSTRRQRSNGQSIPRTLVIPTPERQAIYNQIREDEARHHKQRCLQQHVKCEERLRPPDPSTARSVTNESHTSANSLSPASIVDLSDNISIHVAEGQAVNPRARRGRRKGPLNAEKRFKTAIKRKLGLVCDYCREKRIVAVKCDHFDLSRLEQAYQATRKVPAQTESLNFTPAPADLIGLEGSANLPSDMSATDDPLGELNVEPVHLNPHQHDLHSFVTGFDMSSLSLSSGTEQVSMGRSYNPGLENGGHLPPTIDPNPIPVGSELSGFGPSGFSSRWKCEYQHPNTDISMDTGCLWTGSLQDLVPHFASSHFEVQEEEFWCQCLGCSSLSLGLNLPTQCSNENCFGGTWRRFLYANAIAETPALTQSGGSESGLSFDARGSGEQMPFSFVWGPAP